MTDENTSLSNAQIKPNPIVENDTAPSTSTSSAIASTSAKTNGLDEVVAADGNQSAQLTSDVNKLPDVGTKTCVDTASEIQVEGGELPACTDTAAFSVTEPLPALEQTSSAGQTSAVEQISVIAQNASEPVLMASTTGSTDVGKSTSTAEPALHTPEGSVKKESTEHTNLPKTTGTTSTTSIPKKSRAKPESGRARKSDDGLTAARKDEFGREIPEGVVPEEQPSGPATKEKAEKDKQKPRKDKSRSRSRSVPKPSSRRNKGSRSRSRSHSRSRSRSRSPSPSPSPSRSRSRSRSRTRARFSRGANQRRDRGRDWNRSRASDSRGHGVSSNEPPKKRRVEPGENQIRLILLGSAQRRYADSVKDKLAQLGIQMNMRFLEGESLGSVIDDSYYDGMNYVLVLGKENERDRTISMRIFTGDVKNSVPNQLSSVESVDTTIRKLYEHMMQHNRIRVHPRGRPEEGPRFRTHIVAEGRPHSPSRFPMGYEGDWRGDRGVERSSNWGPERRAPPPFDDGAASFHGAGDRERFGAPPKSDRDPRYLPEQEAQWRADRQRGMPMGSEDPRFMRPSGGPVRAELMREPPAMIDTTRKSRFSDSDPHARGPPPPEYTGAYSGIAPLPIPSALDMSGRNPHLPPPDFRRDTGKERNPVAGGGAGPLMYQRQMDMENRMREVNYPHAMTNAPDTTVASMQMPPPQGGDINVQEISSLLNILQSSVMPESHAQSQGQPSQMYPPSAAQHQTSQFHSQMQAQPSYPQQAASQQLSSHGNKPEWQGRFSEDSRSQLPAPADPMYGRSDLQSRSGAALSQMRGEVDAHERESMLRGYGQPNLMQAQQMQAQQMQAQQMQAQQMQAQPQPLSHPNLQAPTQARAEAYVPQQAMRPDYGREGGFTSGPPLAYGNTGVGAGMGSASGAGAGAGMYATHPDRGAPYGDPRGASYPPNMMHEQISSQPPMQQSGGYGPPPTSQGRVSGSEMYGNVGNYLPQATPPSAYSGAPPYGSRSQPSRDSFQSQDPHYNPAHFDDPSSQQLRGPPSTRGSFNGRSARGGPRGRRDMHASGMSEASNSFGGSRQGDDGDSGGGRRGARSHR